MIVTFGPWLKRGGCLVSTPAPTDSTTNDDERRRRRRRSKPFGPWLKGRVLGQHTCPYGLHPRSPLRFTSRRRLRRTTTTNDDDDEDEASPSGPGSRGGCLASTPAPTDCVCDHHHHRNHHHHHRYRISESRCTSRRLRGRRTTKLAPLSSDTGYQFDSVGTWQSAVGTRHLAVDLRPTT